MVIAGARAYSGGLSSQHGSGVETLVRDKAPEAERRLEGRASKITAQRGKITCFQFFQCFRDKIVQDFQLFTG